MAVLYEKEDGGDGGDTACFCFFSNSPPSFHKTVPWGQQEKKQKTGNDSRTSKADDGQTWCGIRQRSNGFVCPTAGKKSCSVRLLVKSLSEFLFSATSLLPPPLERVTGQ